MNIKNDLHEMALKKMFNSTGFILQCREICSNRLGSFFVF